jgi:hypothetical protein
VHNSLSLVVRSFVVSTSSLSFFFLSPLRPLYLSFALFASLQPALLANLHSRPVSRAAESDFRLLFSLNSFSSLEQDAHRSPDARTIKCKQGARRTGFRAGEARRVSARRTACALGTFVEGKSKSSGSAIETKTALSAGSTGRRRHRENPRRRRGVDRSAILERDENVDGERRQRDGKQSALVLSWTLSMSVWTSMRGDEEVANCDGGERRLRCS